ncbi:YybH family protein [Flavobacterium soyangense]|uniref:Nuclear transport factor 2 family protein n=1 Tax=Flavobacterium soyangense TaxID=2023265 RepID=A0A930Y032_9FLAO|nr:nuclear transport factor 2 family protein [Flavobacterium soyangense]MBF2709533.1 nuclear transport factor 2 family protein [Flavobacterium soyangense]
MNEQVFSKLIIDGTIFPNENAEINALSKFYKAFNNQDMLLMEQSWLNTAKISMDNPIGGIRRGWDEIGNGYNKIFNGKAKVYVEFYDFSIHKTENMFFATGRERGYFKTEEIEISLAIRTTRIFVLNDGSWRQIHHHGSIDNPELLKSYQEAILK